MDATTITNGPSRAARWRRHAMLGLLIAGILLGSATTSVVWASHQFSDVPNSHQFHSHIDWAADNGIVSGYSDGTFRPNDPVSRSASVAFLRRYNNSITIVHNPGTMTNASEANNTVSCPAGKRPIAGGGSTDAFNLFLTDVTITSTSVSVRWETDNNALQSATTDAWATCVPA
jgi:S-layer homology domain